MNKNLDKNDPFFEARETVKEILIKHNVIDKKDFEEEEQESND